MPRPTSVRLRRAVFGVAASLIVGVAIYVQTRGGLGEIFQSPATLAKGSQSTQGGIEILGIARATEADATPLLVVGESSFNSPNVPLGSTIVWLRLPEPKGLRKAPPDDQFKVSCVIGGQEYRLGWEIANGQEAVIHFAIPPGYPDSVREAKLRIVYKDLPACEWSLTRLPAAHRTTRRGLPSSVTLGDVEVEASARTSDLRRIDNPGQETAASGLLHLDLRSHAQPGVWHIVQVDGQETEWFGGKASGPYGTQLSTRLEPSSTSPVNIPLHFAFFSESRWMRVTGSVETRTWDRPKFVLNHPQVTVGPKASSLSWLEVGAVDLEKGLRGTLGLSLVKGAHGEVAAYRFQPAVSVTETNFRGEMGTLRLLSPAELPKEISDRIIAAVRANRQETIALPDVTLEYQREKVTGRVPFELETPIGPPTSADRAFFLLNARHPRK